MVPCERSFHKKRNTHMKYKSSIFNGLKDYGQGHGGRTMTLAPRIFVLVAR